MADKEDMVGNFNKNLIFIAGPAHSGTSLLEVLLRHHSAIGSAPLRSMDENCLEMYQNNDIAECINSSECPRGSALYDTDSCIRTSLSSSHKFFLYKNPDNIFYLNKIKESLIKSKVIIIYRNPKDTALSLLARGRHSTFRECLEYWADVYACIERFESEDFCLVVKYEELVEATKRELGRVFDFLEIEDQAEAILKKYNNHSKQYYLSYKSPRDAFLKGAGSIKLLLLEKKMKEALDLVLELERVWQHSGKREDEKAYRGARKTLNIFFKNRGAFEGEASKDDTNPCEKREHILHREHQLAQKIYKRKRRKLTPDELIVYNEVILKTSYKD